MEKVFINGSGKKVLNHERYTKGYGAGILKVTYAVDRYDLDDGNTYIVVPTKLVEMGPIKKGLNDMLTKYKVKKG